MNRFNDIANRLFPKWSIWHVIAYAALCLLAFAPYISIFYPGIVEIDTSFQLAMSMGYSYGTIKNYPSPFPPFDIRLLGALFSIGETIGGTQSSGIFAICLFQCVGISVSISLASCYLSKWKIPAFARFIVFIFTAVVPIIPLAAIDIGKDTIFCAFFIPFTICLIELIRRTSVNAKTSISLIIYTIIFAFLAACTASKGFIIILISVLITLAFALKRRSVTCKSIANILSACLVLQVIMSVAVIPILSNELPSAKGAFLRESLGTFMQQISWVEKVSGDLTANEREQANHFFDLDSAANNYISSTSDNTKEFTHRNVTIADATCMLRTYISVGVRHPKSYLKSFIDLYEGYWKLGTVDSIMIPRLMPKGTAGDLNWNDDTFSFPGNIDQAIEHIENEWVSYSFGLLPEYADAHPDFGQWEMNKANAQPRIDILTYILKWGEIPVLNLLVSKSFYVLYVPLALLSLVLLASKNENRWVALCLTPLGAACLFAFMSPADLTRYVYPCMFLIPMMTPIVLSSIFGKEKRGGPK